jgi:hypothetical protein
VVIELFPISDETVVMESFGDDSDSESDNSDSEGDDDAQRGAGDGLGDDEVDEVEELEVEVEASEVLIVRLEPGYARAFVRRAQSVVSAGRAPCQFCGNPIDPAGHLCPRANGFRRIAD